MNLSACSAIQANASTLKAHFRARKDDQPAPIQHPESLAFKQRFETSYTPAAVLIPIINTPTGLEVLLTQRADHLRHHPGQISFPGGRKEPTDLSNEAAALRETYEEVGLSPDKVQILGQLGEYYTVSGYQIRPVIGLIESSFEVKLDANEVSRILTVPFNFLMTPANFELVEASFNNEIRTYYSASYNKNIIWGVTAGIIMALYETLSESHLIRDA